MADADIFEQVRFAVEGFVASVPGALHATAHGRGVKVWFDDSTREHYEAQLIRIDGQVRLEIGFHAEHAKRAENTAALARLLDASDQWRAELGDEAEAGPFLGRDGWVRISEVWDAPEPGPIDVVIEIAARLAEYINALEPVRRSGR